ncbi:MAG: bifunctional hydroxymethylpyrimidine kinase/phosphomethylpyrimidine kinase [Euryarchaeota archaeon]|nr:bifunctional hydroxymethylpyrimidine kinase/phosphomethylpyrimidine kinase [Euryarchaeota archaeon]
MSPRLSPWHPRALTIAGVDPGGGAGVAADLKTFAALGVHGLCAVSALTLQDTRRVHAIVDVEPAFLRRQIEVVLADPGADAVKTGMLHGAGLVGAVVAGLRGHRLPLVVDPVMAAGGGDPLQEAGATRLLREHLIPRAAVVTPNIPEARALTGVPIRGRPQMERAARKLMSLGPGAIVIKGGHLRGGNSPDLLATRRGLRWFEGERVPGRAPHGAGCVFSAALTAGLAREMDLAEAVVLARETAREAIRGAPRVGRGRRPVDPLARERRGPDVLREMADAVRTLEETPGLGVLAPESQMNLAYALPGARGVEEVAGIPGRIVRIGGRLRASGTPMWGGSGHVARAVLAAHRVEPRVRAGLNIRYDPRILRGARRLGLQVSGYDRRREPKARRGVEGHTVAWGTGDAIHRNRGRVPHLVYHRGDWGKEPMIVLLGETPGEVVQRAIRLGRGLK